MNPKWLNFRVVNNVPYHMNEQGMWVSQFDGRVLTEAQLNNYQSQGLMYMDDGWDTPPDIEFIYTGAGQPTIHGLTSAPGRPRSHYKDYNRVKIEVWGAGGAGANGNGPTNNGGGGGAGGYARDVFEFDRNTKKGVTIDFNLTATQGVFAKIFDTDGTTRIGGMTAYHGLAGAVGRGGTGGTAATLNSVVSNGVTATGLFGFSAGAGAAPAGNGAHAERVARDFGVGGAGGFSGSANGGAPTNPGAGGGGGWSGGSGYNGASGGVRLTYFFAGRS